MDVSSGLYSSAESVWLTGRRDEHKKFHRARYVDISNHFWVSRMAWSPWRTAGEGVCK